PSHEEEDVVGEPGRDEGIGNRYEGRRIKDDEIELPGQTLHKGSHDIGIEDLYRALRIAPSRELRGSPPSISSKGLFDRFAAREIFVDRAARRGHAERRDDRRSS